MQDSALNQLLFYEQREYVYVVSIVDAREREEERYAYSV